MVHKETGSSVRPCPACTKVQEKGLKVQLLFSGWVYCVWGCKDLEAQLRLGRVMLSGEGGLLNATSQAPAKAHWGWRGLRASPRAVLALVNANLLGTEPKEGVGEGPEQHFSAPTVGPGQLQYESGERSWQSLWVPACCCCFPTRGIHVTGLTLTPLFPGHPSFTSHTPSALRVWG